jgi:hypothetical protein
MAAMKDPRWRAYLGSVLVATGLVALAVSGDLAEHGARSAAFYSLSAAGLALVASATRSLPLRGVIVVAVLLRLVFLPVSPSLTDDYHRYVWDGRVQLAGMNPYVHPPRSPALDGVDYADRDAINHAGLRTVYPPLAQATFLGVAVLHGDLVALKLLFGLFDLASAVVVWWLAGTRRRHAATVLYLLCPAVILQTWGQAHLEAVAIFLVVLAAALLAHRRDAAAGVALGLAVAFRITPLVLLVPALIGDRARPLRFLAGFAPALLIPYAPYVMTGGAFGSLFESGSRWTGGALVFSLMTYVAPRSAALALSFVIAAAGSVLLARAIRGRERTAAACAWVLTLLVVCLPVVHSWYWLPPLALGLAGGVWLPVVIGTVAPLAGAFGPQWSRYLPPWPQQGALVAQVDAGAVLSRRRGGVRVRPADRCGGRRAGSSSCRPGGAGRCGPPSRRDERARRRLRATPTV